MCDTFKYFWKTNKDNEIGYLLLRSLDKVVKEKDELKDLDSQIKHCINNLKTYVHPERDSYLQNCRHRFTYILKSILFVTLYLSRFTISNFLI